MAGSDVLQELIDVNDSWIFYLSSSVTVGNVTNQQAENPDDGVASTCVE
jgi:hypothetical protein